MQNQVPQIVISQTFDKSVHEQDSQSLKNFNTQTENSARREESNSNLLNLQTINGGPKISIRSDEFQIKKSSTKNLKQMKGGGKKTNLRNSKLKKNFKRNFDSRGSSQNRSGALSEDERQVESTDQKQEGGSSFQNDSVNNQDSNSDSENPLKQKMSTNKLDILDEQEELRASIESKVEPYQDSQPIEQKMGASERNLTLQPHRVKANLAAVKDQPVGPIYGYQKTLLNAVKQSKNVKGKQKQSKSPPKRTKTTFQSDIILSQNEQDFSSLIDKRSQDLGNIMEMTKVQSIKMVNKESQQKSKLSGKRNSMVQSLLEDQKIKLIQTGQKNQQWRLTNNNEALFDNKEQLTKPQYKIASLITSLNDSKSLKEKTNVDINLESSMQTSMQTKKVYLNRELQSTNQSQVNITVNDLDETNAMLLQRNEQTQGNKLIKKDIGTVAQNPNEEVNNASIDSNMVETNAHLIQLKVSDKSKIAKSKSIRHSDMHEILPQSKINKIHARNKSDLSHMSEGNIMVQNQLSSQRKMVSSKDGESDIIESQKRKSEIQDRVNLQKKAKKRQSILYIPPTVPTDEDYHSNSDNQSGNESPENVPNASKPLNNLKSASLVEETETKPNTLEKNKRGRRSFWNIGTDQKSTEVEKQKEFQEMYRKRANQIMQSIDENHAEYFKGRQIPFQKDVDYVQSLWSPTDDGSFITVQIQRISVDKKNTTVNESKDTQDQYTFSKASNSISEDNYQEQIIPGGDPSDSQFYFRPAQAEYELIFDNEDEVEAQVFGETDGSIQIFNYADICEVQNSKFELTEQAIISYWHKDPKQNKLQCLKSLTFPNPLKCLINKERNLHKVIFQGEDGELFFFYQTPVKQSNGRYKNQIQIGILNFDESIGTQQSESGGQEQIISCVQFTIPSQSALHMSLCQYLNNLNSFEELSKIKVKSKKNLNEKAFFDVDALEYAQRRPLTLFNNGTYCAFTKYQMPHKPSLCIQKISGLVDQSLYEEKDGDHSAKFLEIQGVEFILGIDGENRIYFLTNEILFDSQVTIQSPISSRLGSKSVVKRIHLSVLESDQFQDPATIQRIDQFMESFIIDGDSKTLESFVKSTLNYPFVEPLMHDNFSKVTFLLSGSSTKENICITFDLLQKLPPVDFSSLEFRGSFFDDQKQQAVNLNFYGSFEFSSIGQTTNMAGSMNDEATNVQFEVTQLNWENKNFVITKLTLDKNWKVVSGQGKSSIFGPLTILPFSSDSESQKSHSQNDLIPLNATNDQQTPHKLEFMMKPMQLNSVLIKFTGYAENGIQMTKLCGVIEQVQAGKPTLIKSVILQRNINLSMKVLGPNLYGRSKTIKGQLIENEESTQSHQFELRLYQYDKEFFMQSISKKPEEVYFEVVDRKVQFGSFVNKNVHKVIKDLQSKNIYVLAGSLSAVVEQTDNIYQQQQGNENDLVLIRISRMYAGGIEERYIDGNMPRSKLISQKQNKSLRTKLNQLNPPANPLELESEQTSFRIKLSNQVKKLMNYTIVKIKRPLNGIMQDLLIGLDNQLHSTFLLTDELTQLQDLCFYSYALPLVEDGDKSASKQAFVQSIQQPLKQQWHFDYPMLAYKSALPDDSELVIINTGVAHQKQAKIDLGIWRFISFIHTAHLSYTPLQESLDGHIFILVQHRDNHKLKVVVVQVNPWQEDEWENDFNSPDEGMKNSRLESSFSNMFNNQENQSNASKGIAQAQNQRKSLKMKVKGQDSKLSKNNGSVLDYKGHASRSSMQGDNEQSYLLQPSTIEGEDRKILGRLLIFSGEVILPQEKDLVDLRRVDLLTDMPFDTTVYCIVAQYDDRIWSCSLNINSAQNKVFNPDENCFMTPTTLVRGINDHNFVYFVANYFNVTKIMSVSVEKEIEKFGHTLVKEAFSFTNVDILGFQQSLEDDDVLIVLDSGFEITWLNTKSLDTKLQVIKQMDLSRMFKDDRLQQILSRSWSPLILSDKYILVDGVYYSVYGDQQMCLTQELDSIQETNLLIQDRAQNHESSVVKLFEQMAVGSHNTIQIFKSSDQRFSPFYFRVKPLPTSRVVDLSGSKRTNSNVKLYLASDESFFVDWKHGGITEFDKNGFVLSYCDNQVNTDPYLGQADSQVNELLKSKISILAESDWSMDNQKFFAFNQNQERNASQEPSIQSADTERMLDKLYLIQVSKNRQKSYLGTINVHEHLKQIRREIIQRGQELMTCARQIQQDGTSMPISKQQQNQMGQSVKLLEKATMITENGNVVMIAIAKETGNFLNPAFSSLQYKEHLFAKPATINALSCIKVFGLYKMKIFEGRQNEIRVCVFTYKNDEDKKFLLTQCKFSTVGESLIYTDQKNMLFWRINLDYQFLDIDEEMREIMRTLKIKKSQVSSLRSMANHSVDIRRISDSKASQDYCLFWQPFKLKGFSLQNLGKEIEGFGDSVETWASMIPYNSTLRYYESQLQPNLDPMVQINIGKHAIVYNIKLDEPQEVAIFDSSDVPTQYQEVSNYGFNQFTLTEGSKSKLDFADFQSLSIQQGEKVQDPLQGLQRSFTEEQYFDLKRILNLINKGHSKIENLQPETLIGIYDGFTFFSIFLGVKQVYDAIRWLFRNLYSVIKVDDMGQHDTIFDGFDKSFTAMLKYQARVKLENKTYRISILRHAIQLEDSLSKINIAQISLFSNQVTLADFTLSMFGMEQFVNSLSKDVIKSLCDKAITNSFTQRINEVEMPVNENFITYGIDFQAITKSDLEKQLVLQKSTNDRRLSNVEVNFIPIGWIYKNNGLQNFLALVRSHKDKLFNTKLINSLFESLWQDYQKEILIYFFLPYLIYFITVVSFFYLNLEPPETTYDPAQQDFYYEIDKDKNYIHAYILLGLITFQLLVEGLKIFDSCPTISRYFSVHFNKVHLTTLILNLTVVLFTVFLEEKLPIQWLRIAAAVMMICLGINLIGWLRLFDNMAQFVSLITETLEDIQAFIVVLLIFVGSCASSLYLLNMNRLPELQPGTPTMLSLKEKDSLVQTPSTLGFLASSIIFQYKIMLGMVDADVTGSYEIWLLLLIFYSTFLTQILILNMLIAIMADAFERHQAFRQHNSIKQKFMLLSEYISLVQRVRAIFRCFSCCKRRGNTKGSSQTNSADYQNKYLIIVEMDSLNDRNEDSWEGKIGMIRQVITQRFEKIEQFFSKNVIKGLTSYSIETKQKLQQIEKDTIYRFLKVNERIEDVSNGVTFTKVKQAQLESRLEALSKDMTDNFTNLQEIMLAHMDEIKSKQDNTKTKLAQQVKKVQNKVETIEDKVKKMTKEK